MLLRTFSLFLLLLPVSSKQNYVYANQLNLPCAALIHQYPLSSPITDLQDDLQQAESSGYEPPIYDEFIATVSPFNFSATSDDKLFTLRSCSDLTPSNYTCSFNDVNYVVDIDKTVSLAFCKPVEQIFLRDCQNTDELIRIIGNIHSSGETLTSVQQVFIFCKCERKYRRTEIELWTDGMYAFVYRCA